MFIPKMLHEPRIRPEIYPSLRAPRNRAFGMIVPSNMRVPTRKAIVVLAASHRIIYIMSILLCFRAELRFAMLAWIGAADELAG
jgi:hypothetical protein